MIRNYRDKSRILMDVAVSKRPSVLDLCPQIGTHGNGFLSPEVSRNAEIKAAGEHVQHPASEQEGHTLSQSGAGGGDGGRYRTRTCDLIRVKDAF